MVVRDVLQRTPGCRQGLHRAGQMTTSGPQVIVVLVVARLRQNGEACSVKRGCNGALDQGSRGCPTKGAQGRQDILSRSTVAQLQEGRGRLYPQDSTPICPKVLIGRAGQGGPQGIERPTMRVRRSRASTTRGRMVAPACIYGAPRCVTGVLVGYAIPLSSCADSRSDWLLS